jgi:hypothetical protein
MSLQDEFEALEQPKKRRCKVCDWYRTLTDEDQDFFDRMKIGNRVRLHAACAAMGLDAEITTLRNHIRDNHDAG